MCSSKEIRHQGISKENLVDNRLVVSWLQAQLVSYAEKKRNVLNILRMIVFDY